MARCLDRPNIETRYDTSPIANESDVYVFRDVFSPWDGRKHSCLSGEDNDMNPCKSYALLVQGSCKSYAPLVVRNYVEPVRVVRTVSSKPVQIVCTTGLDRKDCELVQAVCTSDDLISVGYQEMLRERIGIELVDHTSVLEC